MTTLNAILTTLAFGTSIYESGQVGRIATYLLSTCAVAAVVPPTRPNPTYNPLVRLIKLVIGHGSQGFNYPEQLI